MNPYWVHHVDVPVKPVKNVVIQASIHLKQPPNNHDVSRFHIQLRHRPGDGYYSVMMDHTGIVTLYFTSIGDDGSDYQKLHTFSQSADFKAGVGETNTLKVGLQGNLFKIQINGGKVEEFADSFDLIAQPGDIKLGVDGSQNTMVEYRIDNLLIQEWPSP